MSDAFDTDSDADSDTDTSTEDANDNDERLAGLSDSKEEYDDYDDDEEAEAHDQHYDGQVPTKQDLGEVYISLKQPSLSSLSPQYQASYGFWSNKQADVMLSSEALASKAKEGTEKGPTP